MARVSYEEILSLQRKVNIVDIVSDYISLSQKGRNYFGVCPFHDDHNPSMSVSPEKQMYKCFVCGAAGNVFNFVSDYEKISYYEAVKVVANKIGENIDIGDTKIIKQDNILYKIYDISNKYYQNYLNTSSGKIAKKYLVSRKINDEIIKHFQIGLSPVDNSLVKLLENKKISNNDILNSKIALNKDNKIYDIYRNRIMFPLWNLDGSVVGFSGRIYDESDTSKYINTMESDIFKKGDLLYNYHNAKEFARKEKEIIVVEGFMDVIRLYSIGIKNVVATMGTAITHTQAKLIRKLSMNIILMFDGDEAGNKATINAIEELKDFDSNIKIVRLEENLDPDEYILKKGKEKLEDHLKHGLSIFDYKSNLYKKKLDFDNSSDISKYINLLKKDLEKIDDDIIRDVEIKKISDLTGVSTDTIKSKLEVKNKDIKVINVPKKIRLNKYQKASEYILFHMINNPNLIDYYYENLSYLPDPVDRMLAGEMVLFNKKFKSFNFNDFITYLHEKKELINRAINISDLDLSLNYNKEEIDDYFMSIKNYLKEKEIEKLTKELKQEKNSVVKKEIAKKIEELLVREKK